MAAYIHGDFSNIRMDMDIDIDNWTCQMRPHSNTSKSYSSGGPPPSIGNVRQMVVSEPSGSNQMYSDGQPPSVNDVGRREPSQSEASCTRYEGSDEHEVQQITSELNNGVYKRGIFERSSEITAYSGHDERTQDLVSRIGSKVSESFEVPPMTFNSIDFSINENGFLIGGVLFPPPQPFQRIRTYTKVYMRGSIGRTIDITAFSGYNQLKQELAQMFGIEGKLDDKHRTGWKLVYVDHENDVLLVGGDPWDEFVACVWSIKILSPQEVQQMSFDDDFG
ncbi:hypothetical protein LXL04_003055 [Taraxacum kok-saghyz]